MGIIIWKLYHTRSMDTNRVEISQQSKGTVSRMLWNSSLRSLIEGHIIRLQMNNTVAIYYINKMGGIISQLSQVPQDLWDWYLKRKTFIIAQYISGTLNTRADSLSRKIYDCND
jgi:hypothetical protein